MVDMGFKRRDNLEKELELCGRESSQLSLFGDPQLRKWCEVGLNY